MIKLFIKEKMTLFSYLIVGALTAIIYLGSFALLWQWMGWNYKVSVTITYLLAILFHFTANRRYTFQAHGSQLPQQIIKYVCMIGVNYLVTLSIMYFIVEWLQWTPYFGLLLAILVSVSLNFLTSRYWVFKKAETVQL